MADSKVLKEQLKLLIENPDAFGEDESSKQELLKLSRVAAATLESPFETIQRLVYSVCVSQPLTVTLQTTQGHNLANTCLQAPTSRRCKDLSRPQHI